ncbi:MAG: hypothetical protein QW112_02285 [Candidatus Micrarchaeia archaeon]
MMKRMEAKINLSSTTADFASKIYFLPLPSLSISILLIVIVLFAAIYAVEICPAGKMPTTLTLMHTRNSADKTIEITAILKGQTATGEIPLENQNITQSLIISTRRTARAPSHSRLIFLTKLIRTQ